MKRLLCGSVVLAASLGLVSCNSDPTSDFRNGPSQILAEPSTVFVDQGDVDEVVVKVVDDAGDPLPATWEVSAGSGITVERNPDFLPTTVGAPLESEAQFIVTAGDTPVASSITVTAGELSVEVPVNVTPTALVATFSNLAPAQNESVTITAEGYTFQPDAAISIAGDSAVILSNDGTTVTFVPTPGATGPALVEKIALDFLPTTPLNLSTTEELTVAPLAPVGGTDDPATAPPLPVPGEGQTVAFFDGPDFTATVNHFYRLDVAEAGDYTITLDWDIGSDIDLIVCFDAACSVGDGQAATGNHPEVGTYTLAPGTYYVLANDFGADAAGARLDFVLQR